MVFVDPFIMPISPVNDVDSVDTYPTYKQTSSCRGKTCGISCLVRPCLQNPFAKTCNKIPMK